MTATVTGATIAAITSTAYGALSSGSGAIAIALFIILVIEHVLLDAYGGSKFKARTKSFNVAAIPLFIIFGYIVILRLVQLLRIL